MPESTVAAVPEEPQPFGLEEHDWDRLLMAIDVGECTPFLGAGASAMSAPLAREQANKWAQNYKYPPPDAPDLARVAQFLAVRTGDQFFPKHLIAKLFRDAPGKQPSALLRVLASLRLPIYMTTNYDDLMACALRDQGVAVRQEVCRWHSQLQKLPSAFDGDFIPDPAHPVVFHLHGVASDPKSLVL